MIKNTDTEILNKIMRRRGQGFRNTDFLSDDRWSGIQVGINRGMIEELNNIKKIIQLGRKENETP